MFVSDVVAMSNLLNQMHDDKELIDKFSWSCDVPLPIRLSKNNKINIAKGKLDENRGRKAIGSTAFLRYDSLAAKTTQKPALYSEGRLLRYFTDICGIGQGFRYAPWRKEFPYAYALFFAFSEVEIKTAQLIHTASQLYNFIAIF